jgi:hypothetical protein
MIRHIVLFNLNPEVESKDRDWLFEQIRHLGDIPSAKRLAIGTLLDARDPAYKSRIATDFKWSLTMEFDDEDGLYAYQKDPTHVAVAQEIRKRASEVKILDFQTL